VEPKKEQLGSIMVRRLKSEINANYQSKKRFPERKIECLKINYSIDEEALHALLKSYSEKSNGSNLEVEKYANQFIVKLLKNTASG
jgi:hypothetical protein